MPGDPGGWLPIQRKRMPQLFLLLCLLLAGSALAGSTRCPSHYLSGAAPDILDQTMTPQTHELCYLAFGVTHSGVTRTPLWSAEHLTRAQLEMARGLPRLNRFHAETGLPAGEQAELGDYAHSGYDRGHLSPAADMPSEEAQLEGFTLANMVPQDPNNNRHLWQRIESVVRKLARADGELYVVTGPIFGGDHPKQLQGRVTVPTQLYKAVYDLKQNEAAAYVVVNEATNDYQVVDIAELERLTGVAPFPALPANARLPRLALPSPDTRRPQPATPEVM